MFDHRISRSVLIGLALALVSACSTKTQEDPGLEVADLSVLFSEGLIRDASENDVPFRLSTRHADEQLEFIADFEFPENDDSQAMVSIVITPAGILLDPNELEETKRQVEALNETRPSEIPTMGIDLFPDIGLRSLRGFSLGPGGGGESLVFTTSDGRFDIEVIQSNHQTGVVDAPNVDCLSIARALSGAYDIRFQP